MLQPKLKQDEPMDTGEIPCEGNNEEEGEIPEVDDGEVFWTEEGYVGHTLPDGSTSYGLLPSALKELKKLSRARRFGIAMGEGNTALVDITLITSLYKSLGMDENNEKHYRFNAVHMRGTENMSSGDVYEYFKMFGPSCIEWINDVSCNIVWVDHFSASKALLNLSKEIKNLDMICFNANPFKRELELNTNVPVQNVDANAVDAREIEGAIPPGRWRIGVPTEKSSTILLRFATRSDKKQKNAEKNSEYYKKYGNPHFGNIPGIVSNSLRNEVLRQCRQRMNNYGKYLVEKKKKNPWGNLAEKWGRQDEGPKERVMLKVTTVGPPSDLRLSIKNRYVGLPKSMMASNSESSQSEDDHARGKFPKMKMYADEEPRLVVTTVRRKPVSQENVPLVEDLRLRINRSRKRRQMIEEEWEQKRMRYWGERASIKEEDDLQDFDDDDADDDEDGGGRTETEVTMEGVKEFHEGEVDYDRDNDDKGDVGVDDDDDDDDEEKGASWALENYSDLRESLTQSKKYKKSGNAEKPEKSESNAGDKDGDDDNDEDDIYNMDINHRSPLQIEFENDDYFEKESV